MPPKSCLTHPAAVVEPVGMWARCEPCPSYPQVGRPRRPPPGFDRQGRNGPLGVVEVDPLADDPLGPEAIRQFVQIDRLVFERPPQAFDEDVVHAPAPTTCDWKQNIIR